MKRMLNRTPLFPALLICLLACPAIFAAETEETTWLAIMLEGHKIGHALQTRSVEGNTVTSSEEMTLRVGRGADAVTMYTKETSYETLEGRPIGFEMVQKVSGFEQKRKGTITPDGQVQMTIEAMGDTRTMTLPFPKDALMTEGLRLLQEKHGLAAGTTFTAKAFRPDMVELLGAIPIHSKVGGKKTIDLFGRVTEAVEVISTMVIGAESISVTSYVDESQNVLKSLVPMMGMTLEMVTCDKEFALRQEDVVDFLSKMCVPCPVELKNPDQAAGAIYELTSLDDSELRIPEDDNQKIEKLDGKRCRVIIRPVQPASGFKFPYEGDNAQLLEAVEPSEYLQCDDPKIMDMAKQAVSGADNAARAARQIEAFVAGYITKKDFSVGYASAKEVAQSRQGDCSEHAVLTAAMCRAVGIPARVVTGLVYAENFAGKRSVFGGHAWAEAWTGEKWIGLDATRAPNGYGPGHIALARGSGSPTDFFSLVNSFGSFSIDKVTLEKKEAAAQ